MGDDNFNTFNGPSGANPALENQQLVDVSGIIQNDVVEVVSTAAEDTSALEIPHLDQGSPSEPNHRQS